ncbi:MAG: CcdB family protein [Achromobacter pestifer]
MARYDVYALDGVGFVVDVQSTYLSGITTRLVMPLVQVEEVPNRNRRLNPIVEFEGDQYALPPQQLSAVLAVDLSRPKGSLKNRADDIVTAIDVVLYGF